MTDASGISEFTWKLRKDGSAITTGGSQALRRAAVWKALKLRKVGMPDQTVLRRMLSEQLEYYPEQIIHILSGDVKFEDGVCAVAER